ncbi:MAG: hypothetical protein MJ070_10845 [Lachnospiraceae bacterium]|nr:hypothetical protein [Lachnospiraceae bacterium]
MRFFIFGVFDKFGENIYDVFHHFRQLCTIHRFFAQFSGRFSVVSEKKTPNEFFSFYIYFFFNGFTTVFSSENVGNAVDHCSEAYARRNADEKTEYRQKTGLLHLLPQSGSDKQPLQNSGQDSAVLRNIRRFWLE